MTICARELADHAFLPPSYFRVRAGESCDATFVLSKKASGERVDWSGHPPRFRIYSQIVDQSVVVEITDPQRCSFGPDGIWRLQMTADQTNQLPRGGMRFTLEYCDSNGQYIIGVHGGVGCRKEDSAGPQARADSPARAE